MKYCSKLVLKRRGVKLTSDVTKTPQVSTRSFTMCTHVAYRSYLLWSPEQVLSLSLNCWCSQLLGDHNVGYLHALPGERNGVDHCWWIVDPSILQVRRQFSLPLCFLEMHAGIKNNKVSKKRTNNCADVFFFFSFHYCTDTSHDKKLQVVYIVLRI